MKKIYTIVIFLLFIASGLFAAKYTITNQGYTFSPNNLNIHVGDTVIFTLEAMHNVVEVNSDTYAANGNTSNGGFTLGYGGGQQIFTNAGTYYYVCHPHASLGMKGIINVSASTAINVENESNTGITIYPNPTANNINVSYKVKQNSVVNIQIIDITGKTVKLLVSEDKTPGVYESSFNVANSLKNGKYFVKYTNGNQSFVQGLLIIR